MRLVSFVLLYSLCCLVSCKEGAEQGTSAPKNEMPVSAKPSSRLGEPATTQLTALLSSYYELKDALVATRAGKADMAAGKLSANADSLKAILNADGTNLSAMSPYLDTIVKQSKGITSMMDEGCERKRLHFDTISVTMYGLIKKAELKNARIYHQYCPMAMNDRGAYWLSNNEEIRNPYFGDKMLECGEVTDTIN